MSEVTYLYIAAGVVFGGLTAWVGWVFATQKKSWALTGEERDALLGVDEAADEGGDAGAKADGVPAAKDEADEPAHKDDADDDDEAEPVKKKA